jgi:hypothetical protein
MPRLPEQPEIGADVLVSRRTHCFNCGRGVGNSHNQIENRFVCDACMESYVYECSQCGTPMTSNSSYTYNDERWCRSCFRATYQYCRSCDSIMALSDEQHLTVYEDGEYHYYCSVCADRARFLASLYEHDYRPRNFTYNNTNMDVSKPRLYYGIEVELSGDKVDRTQLTNIMQDVPDSVAYPVHDGSISFGFEIVSQPATLNWIRQNIKHWENMFCHYTDGWDSEDAQCGIHIHMSKSAFTRLQLFKFMRVFYDENWRDFIIAVSGRTHMGQLEHYSSIRDDSDARLIDKARTKAGTNKYTAVNLLNNTTVEVRIFQSTMKVGVLLRYLEFVQSLYDYALEAGLQDYNTPIGYLRWVLDRRHFYPCVVTYLKGLIDEEDAPERMELKVKEYNEVRPQRRTNPYARVNREVPLEWDSDDDCEGECEFCPETGCEDRCADYEEPPRAVAPPQTISRASNYTVRNIRTGEPVSWGDITNWWNSPSGDETAR